MPLVGNVSSGKGAALDFFCLVSSGSVPPLVGLPENQAPAPRMLLHRLQAEGNSRLQVRQFRTTMPPKILNLKEASFTGRVLE